MMNSDSNHNHDDPSNPNPQQQPPPPPPPPQQQNMNNMNMNGNGTHAQGVVTPVKPDNPFANQPQEQAPPAVAASMNGGGNGGPAHPVMNGVGAPTPPPPQQPVVPVTPENPFDSSLGSRGRTDTNYTVEDRVEERLNGDWGQPSFPPPDEDVYQDEGPMDGVADGAYANDIYEEPAASSGIPHEAYEDPYAESPYGEAFDDPYANTPYAMDRHDPYGELDYSGRPTPEDLDDLELSRRDHPDNLHGGEYEMESHDPKTQGWQAFCTKNGKTLATILSFTCMATVLAAIILVASAGGGNTHRSGVPHHPDGSLSPWGRRQDQIHTGSFVPPPLALETTCTQENIATQEGFDACSALCDPAQCCRFDPMAAPHMSCQRGHVQDCHTYHHYCERPPKAAIIPFTPPPADIHELCVAEKMHTAEGVTACARACQGGTCCRYPTTLTGLSCLRGNEGQCQIYHNHCEQPPPEQEEENENYGNGMNSGGNPGEISFPFVKPPADIQEKCAGAAVATAKGFEECLEICRSGTCCRFDPDREPNLSCRRENPDDCPIYDQYCGGNTDVISSNKPHPDGGTGVSGGNPDSATYVEKVCSDHSLATVEGFADCAQACSEHECCWKKEFGTTCPVGTHCEPYSHCLAMEASDHLDVAIEVAINMKCTDDLIATVEGRKDCLLACSQATCCFGPSAGDCPQANDSFCNQYDACAKVAHHENVPPAPKDLNQHCQRDNLNTLEGLAECDKRCSHATCCWKDDPNQPSCEKTNPFCADYAACFILEEGTMVQTYPPVPEAPSTLKDICDNADDRTACVDACQPAECCWKSGHCLRDQPNQCEPYVPCAILLDGIEDAPSNLGDVCTRELVATGPGKAACESVCDPAACCWRTGACLGTHSDQCQGYVSCAVLYSSDDSSEPASQAPVAEAPFLIQETCASNNVNEPDGEMLCADACKPAECCWKTGACLGSQPETCEGYVPCAVLLQEEDESDTTASSSSSSESYSSGSSSSTSTEFDEAPTTLDQTCSRDKVATPDGLDDCSKACKPSECCWKTGSCLGTQPEKCEGYVPCAVLMDGTISAAAPADIGDVCTQAAVDTAAGLAACEAMCLSADCCWKSGTCLGSQPNICEGYVPCALLNDVQTTVTPAPLPSAPSFLKDVCTAEKVLNVEGAILCQDACKAAECCWKTGSCLGTQAQQCEGYVPCAVLNGSDNDEDGIPLASIPKVPTYLSTVCGSEIAGDEVHGHLCINACERADCCWDDNSASPCKNDPNCSDGYNICSSVNFDTIVPPTPEPATPAPQPTLGPQPTPAPQQGPTPAPTQGPTPAAVDQGYSEEMIADACLNHDNSIVNLCAKVCEPSHCCFDRDGDNGESCPDDFPCFKYGSCSTLHPVDDYVDTACQSDDLSDCVAACGGSTCCFTNDISKTCAETNPNIICSRYTACEKLYGV